MPAVYPVLDRLTTPMRSNSPRLFPTNRLQTPDWGNVVRRGVACASISLACGCAQLPDTRFLARQTAHQAAEFKSAWGPIPEKRSAALMAELQRKAGNLDIVERQATLEQALAGAPLVVGNKVTVLLDGPATYDAMFAAMRDARHHINIESYIIEDGEVGQKFADLLLERRTAGVQVNVMYDSVGAFKTPKDYFDRLRAAGVNVVAFNPINPLAPKKRWSITHRDHRKLLIVDGRTAFLGGINIDDVYSTGSSTAGHSSASTPDKKDPRRSGWRDTDIRIDGPVVPEFQKLFLQTWDRQLGPPLVAAEYLPQVAPQGKDIVRAIGSTPDDAYNALYLSFVAAITNAEKQVYITNAYFVPDPQLVDALRDAAGRGVDVRLVLPSTTDSRSAAYAAHSHYTALLEAGVKIYERRAALLHAKTAVIDGVWSCVGSANLDWRSGVYNDELAAVILGREFGERMVAVYAQDLAQSDEIDLEHWRHRPLRQRLKEWFFRLGERLL
jgi:cardiolipin synthase